MDTNDSGAWSPSRAWAKRPEKRRPRYLLWIDMWPFTAVMVTLLIIFMLLPGRNTHHGKSVDLPRILFAAAQPNALREDVMKITVWRDGRIIFRNDLVNPTNLKGLIQEAMKAGAERKVYLAVDARSKYGDVEPVLDQIRYAGIRQICILAEKQSK